jgi:hypothetical protein
MTANDIDEIDVTRSGAALRKCGVLVLAVAIVGLPINEFGVYALLMLLTVVVFSGKVRSKVGAWIRAIVITCIAVIGQFALTPPRIDEGHNVFLPGGPTQALKQGLPAQVYEQLSAEFDKQYPPQQRCQPAQAGCWAGLGFPDRTFAFSADGIFHKSEWSRSVTGIRFSDPVWLRLGFFNDVRYNWYSESDVRRASRTRPLLIGLHHWHVIMPWFEVIRLPAGYVGGELCWRGQLMWEGSNELFSLTPRDRCRSIEPADVGRRVVGLAIRPESFAMQLKPPWPVLLLQIGQKVLMVGAIVALALTLIIVRARELIVPLAMLGLSILVVVAQDANFLGGEWPLEGGDDGLFYDGVGRMMLQSLLAGDFSSFLMGGERVFYYGGPGLRYFRAFEHVIFGETFLGYLSLILVMPFLVWTLYRRFLSKSWALVLGLCFIAIPFGKLFGTTFLDYLAWAERGYADPAAYIFFIAGILPLLGAKPWDAAPSPGALKSEGTFSCALFGALLLALGIFMKPMIAPAAAVFLAGAGLAATYWRQWWRLAGLCIGILPVFLITLHNWVFGHVFVLFSTNATHPLVLNMPPAAWAGAFKELVTIDFAHGQAQRALMKVLEWLSSGPTQSLWTAPLNAAGVIILLYVVAVGRRFDPWLRLIGAAAIAQHMVAFFYVPTARYHFLTWFLTMLVVMVFVQKLAVDWLRQKFPNLRPRLADFFPDRRLRIKRS